MLATHENSLVLPQCINLDHTEIAVVFLPIKSMPDEFFFHIKDVYLQI